jgi:hypothetical protein
MKLPKFARPRTKCGVPLGCWQPHTDLGLFPVGGPQQTDPNGQFSGPKYDPSLELAKILMGLGNDRSSHIYTAPLAVMDS